MSGAASLQQFIDDPGAWGDPALLASLIAPGLRADTAARLMASPRTGRRASRALAEQIGMGDADALDGTDRALVLASPVELDEVAAAAGAVWHARRLRALVRGPDIAALAARFGAGAREAALRHEPPASARPVATEDLAADIARDGQDCVSAWMAGLPGWAAARLRLVRPWPPTPADAPARVAVIRLLAGARV